MDTIEYATFRYDTIEVENGVNLSAHGMMGYIFCTTTNTIIQTLFDEPVTEWVKLLDIKCVYYVSYFSINYVNVLIWHPKYPVSLWTLYVLK